MGKLYGAVKAVWLRPAGVDDNRVAPPRKGHILRVLVAAAAGEQQEAAQHRSRDQDRPRKSWQRDTSHHWCCLLEALARWEEPDGAGRVGRVVPHLSGLNRRSGTTVF